MTIFTDYETQYQIELARDDGTVIATLDQAGTFEYTRVANGIGYFSIQLPPTFDQSLIAQNRRVVFWRKAPGGSLTREFQGLIRRPVTQGIAYTRFLQGYDFNYLLSKRAILYASDTAQASMTGNADDLMKSIVTQNLGTSAAAARQFSSTYFTVAANVSAGPSLTFAFAWQNVIDVLIALGKAARTAGTEVFFNMDAVDNASIQFRTYINQPGANRTEASGVNPVIFSAARGNLIDPQLIEDATDEVNAVTVTGQGTGSTRITVARSDTARTTQNIWAYAESTLDRRDLSTTASLQAAGDAALIDGRIKNQLSGTLLSIPNSIYGVHWSFGDKVTIDYANRQFSAIVRAVRVAVNETRQETIAATFEAYL